MALRRWLRPVCFCSCSCALFLLLHVLRRGDDAFTLRPEQSLGYFDASGRFKVLSHLFVASNWTQLNKEPLCVAVQASLDHSFRLVELVKAWPGAVSCALYAPGEEFALTLAFVEHLRRCYPEVRRQVNFHLVHPTKHAPSRRPLRPPAPLLSCQLQPEEVMRHLLRMRSNRTAEWRLRKPYPQNVLRNVARAHCAAEWVACPDVDMVLPPPSPHSNVPRRLSRFLRSREARKCKNCAFVLPVYEIKETESRLPSNKSELLRMCKARVARPYHKMAFSLNQRSTNFSRWERLEDGDDVNIAYAVERFLFHYEPVYVARQGTPPFAERYEGYGMTRNSQAYEMFLANFTFLVLDNVFLNHWGFQLKRSATSRIKFKQVQRNHRRFFSGHLQELAAKYDWDPLDLLKAHVDNRPRRIEVRPLLT